MDISRATNEKKLQLSRTYFKTGFALLPFLWAINVCWFFQEAFRKPPFAEQQQIKKYVIYSAFGAFIWLVIFISWIIVFQTNRADWGATADYMSFIIPLGKA